MRVPNHVTEVQALSSQHCYPVANSQAGSGATSERASDIASQICINMAEGKSQVVAKKALKKLEDQLTCAVCLEDFKHPKLLQCFHVYCKDCLKPLVVQDKQGQLSLCCPTCRQSTLLPPGSTVSDLQPAFHIHHLLEIQEALEKLKEPQKVQCDKCKFTPQPATSYCRDCGEFICAICTTVHREWQTLSEHEVVALEQLESRVKQVDALKKVTLFCSLHNGKELELYCETCEELICHNCTVKKHKEHRYDLVSDTFETHKTEITASMEPIENHLSVVNNSLEELRGRTKELSNQRASNEAKIQREIQQLHKLIEVRKAELISQNDQMIEIKLKNLSAQEDELETLQTQLVSCLSFMRESLRTGSQGEVMKVKKTAMKQMKEMTDNFKPDSLRPCEDANVKFIASGPNLTQAYQEFGRVVLQKSSPKNCYTYTTGIVKKVKVDERVTAILHVVDDEGKACTTPVETPTCELVPVVAGEKTDCHVKKVAPNQYEISYQPTTRGRYQLHIKVEGGHIKGSPFSVIVKDLNNIVQIIEQVKEPTCITLDKTGNMVVAEDGGECVSVFSPAGEKLRSFGSDKLSDPRGVAMDDDGNILVVDMDRHCIQQFTSNGNFITTVGNYGTHGSSALKFKSPVGAAFRPLNKKIYVADYSNNCIQVLNPDLTFYKSFGSSGTGNGELRNPTDMAFDNAGNVYVADVLNACIQVFTSEGEFLRVFGKRGQGNGELFRASRIEVSTENIVYVSDWNNHRVSMFTSEGKFLKSFGGQGNGPGQFNQPRGITIDNNGVIYVCDGFNNRLQLFC